MRGMASENINEKDRPFYDKRASLFYFQNGSYRRSVGRELLYEIRNVSIYILKID